MLTQNILNQEYGEWMRNGALNRTDFQKDMERKYPETVGVVSTKVDAQTYYRILSYWLAHLARAGGVDAGCCDRYTVSRLTHRAQAATVH